MSGQHTPGPWVVIDHRHLNGNYWIGVDEFTSHAEVRAGCGEAEELGDTLANARLIASAPDLLAALQDMLSGWQYIRNQHGDLYGVGWDRAETAAKTAIAAATGEA